MIQTKLKSAVRIGAISTLVVMLALSGVAPFASPAMAEEDRDMTKDNETEFTEFDQAVAKHYDSQKELLYVLDKGTDQDVHIIDVSDRNNPVIKSTVSWADTYESGRDLILSGDTMFVLTNDGSSGGGSSGGVESFDVSDPNNPTQLDDVEGISGMEMVKDGNYILASDKFNGRIVSFDVSNPSNMSLVSSVGTGMNTPRAVVKDGNTLYIPDDSNDNIHTVDISDPSSPTLIANNDVSANISGPKHMRLNGDYGYVGAVGTGSVDSVYTVNKSDPSNVAVVHELNHSDAFEMPIGFQVTDNGSRLFAAGRNSGNFTKMDISDPSEPQIITMLGGFPQIHRGIFDEDESHIWLPDRDGSTLTYINTNIQPYTTASSSTSPDQSVGLVEDDYEIFPPADTEVTVYKRSTEYVTVEDGMAVDTWHRETWEKTETSSFNWQNKTTVSLEDTRYYRMELESPHGNWEDSGFVYDEAEMKGSTIWLEPDPSSTDTNGDGTTGGSTSTGTNVRDYDSSTSTGSTPTADSDGNYPTATEQQGFGPTALGTCETLDGQDGVEVEYWDPNYETYELRGNLTVDGSTTYHVRKSFDTARGYYRGCIADSMTDNASSERSDLGFNHTALDQAGNEISTGSESWSAPTFGPTGNAPSSTGERLGLLAGVLGALGALWIGGNRVVPASSVPAWPSETINPAFGIGAPVVGLLGLDLAGGGVISAGVATGLAQIAPFAGIVGVSVVGYAALRWIRAPPTS